jgi:hypothetical protein
MCIVWQTKCAYDDLAVVYDVLQRTSFDKMNTSSSGYHFHRFWVNSEKDYIVIFKSTLHDICEREGLAMQNITENQYK